VLYDILLQPILNLPCLIMKRITWYRFLLALLSFALSTGLAAHDDACLIAFDLGSSGVRAGIENSSSLERASLNALGLLNKGADVSVLETPTSEILNELLHKRSFGASCDRLGGGFSVWRRAVEQDRKGLGHVLERIRDKTGVAILVVPPEKEGQYAYFAAQKSLGQNLTTTHVLDIGGGSLQISSSTGAWGLPLGQKTWHQLLCNELGRSNPECVLEPLSDSDLEKARKLAASEINALVQTLPPRSSLTAVSRPVTRGVKPYLDEIKHLELTGAGSASTKSDDLVSVLEIRKLSLAVDLAASKQIEEKKNSNNFYRYLLSDMLLTESVMKGMGLETINVADIDLSNVPGLLNDARAYAWLHLYRCYLRNLIVFGISAFDLNPGECRP
jgi:hypothetical protein